MSEVPRRTIPEKRTPQIGSGATKESTPIDPAPHSQDFSGSSMSPTPITESTQGREGADDISYPSYESSPPKNPETSDLSLPIARASRMGGGPVSAEPHSKLATPRTLLPISTFPNPKFPASADREELGSFTPPPIPTPKAMSQFLPLRLHAEMYEDAVKAYVAISNRSGRSGLDPDVYSNQVKLMKLTKEELGKALVAVYYQVVPQSIIDWQESTPALGAHTLARLLGITGHPRIAFPHHWEGEGDKRVLVADEPYLRTIGQFRAYCGHGDPARKRRKGISAEEGAALGNPRAKMVTYLLADAARKNRKSPYRVVYDEARVKYAERDWTLGHQDAAAMRKVGKAILKDLWTVTESPSTPLTPPHP